MAVKFQFGSGKDINIQMSYMALKTEKAKIYGTQDQFSNLEDTDPTQVAKIQYSPNKIIRCMFS